MKHIKLVANLMDPDTDHQSKDLAVSHLFEGESRKVVAVRLQNNAVLARHHADIPITVQCISGKGVFAAGAKLDEFQELRPGVLLTLEAGVEHEVVADPDVYVLVTKFTHK